MKAWNIKQLADARRNDLSMCRTDHERLMCGAICDKEIRETARDIQQTRKLTPGERAILESLGVTA